MNNDKWMSSGYQGFPDSSVGKESACNAEDPSSIPWSGRSAGEGRSYPLQYSWTSLVAQLVKNPPAMRETWVQSQDWEDPLEKRKATHSSILVWRIPWTVYSAWGHKDLDTTEPLSLSYWIKVHPNDLILTCHFKDLISECSHILRF